MSGSTLYTNNCLEYENNKYITQIHTALYFTLLRRKIFSVPLSLRFHQFIRQ
jgi:hypothetical protein